MRSSLLEDTLDLEALGLSLHSLLINPAQEPTPKFSKTCFSVGRYINKLQSFLPQKYQLVYILAGVNFPLKIHRVFPSLQETFPLT